MNLVNGFRQMFIREAGGFLLGIILIVPANAMAAEITKRKPAPSGDISADLLAERIVSLLSEQRAAPGFKGISSSSWNRLSARPMVPSPYRTGVLRMDAKVREGWSYWIESRERPNGGNVIAFYVVGEQGRRVPGYCTFSFAKFADRLRRNGFDHTRPQVPPGSPRIHFFSRPHLPVVVITYVPTGSVSGESCVESIQVEPSEQGNG